MERGFVRMMERHAAVALMEHGVLSQLGVLERQLRLSGIGVVGLGEGMTQLSFVEAWREK